MSLERKEMKKKLLRNNSFKLSNDEAGLAVGQEVSNKN